MNNFNYVTIKLIVTDYLSNNVLGNNNFFFKYDHVLKAYKILLTQQYLKSFRN